MAGPMDGIYFIHDAIRGDTQHFQDASGALASADAGQVASFEERFRFFRDAVKEHEEGEESFMFSALLAKVPHLGETYTMDHRANDTAVAKIDEALSALRKAAGAGERAALAAQLAAQATALNTLMSHHLAKEEQLLLPIMDAHFSVEEQGAMVEKLQQHIAPEVMMQMLAWVFKAQDLGGREGMLRMFMQEMPPPVFAAGSQAMKGAVSADEWAQMTQRIPELA